MIFAALPVSAAAHSAMLGLALAVALLSVTIDILFRLHLSDRGGIDG